MLSVFKVNKDSVTTPFILFFYLILLTLNKLSAFTECLQLTVNTHTCRPWSSSSREKYENCFLKIRTNFVKYGEPNTSKFVVNLGWPSSWACNMLEIKKNIVKNIVKTTYLSQNYIFLYFESYWKSLILFLKTGAVLDHLPGNIKVKIVGSHDVQKQLLCCLV